MTMYDSSSLWIELVINQPPSWNSVYKTSRRGQVYMTRAGKEWKKLTTANLKTLMHCENLQTIEGKVCIDYKIYLSNVERSDIDNRLKLTNDVLEAAGVIVNDNRIFGAHIVKYKCPRAKQRIHLSIYKFNG